MSNLTSKSIKNIVIAAKQCNHRYLSMYATELINQLPASGIRDIMVKASALEAEGRKIIHLEVGQPNFPSPSPVIEATIKALRDNQTAYVPNDGIKALKSTVAEHYCKRSIQTSPNQVVVTTGDECLIPFPGFVTYYQGITMVGGFPVPYVTDSSMGYLPTIHMIKNLISQKTRCIVLCNPGNPTGACFDRQLVADIVKLTQDHGIYLISDEIYGDLRFDGEHVCAAEFEGSLSESNVAVVSGVSKSYAMTGFRVGWTRCSTSMASQLTKIQEPILSCGVPFAQIGAIIALKECESHMQMMKTEYKRRRDASVSILAQRGRPCTYVPGGAFYLPLDISKGGIKSFEFATKLLNDKGVGVAPGLAFDTALSYRKRNVLSSEVDNQMSILNSFVRVSLANSLENVTEGINSICDLLDELEHKN